MSTTKEIFGLGEAVVSRIDQGHGPALNWEQVKEAVEHPTTGLKRDQLVQVIAYLGAQLVGSRDSVDKNAAMAMVQIEHILREYAARKGRGE